MEEYKQLIALLNKLGGEIRDKYKAKLKSKGSYATGKLYNSIGYKLIISETGIKLDFVAEKYYINIENGRKAGGEMPPISLIRKWMISRSIPDTNGAAYRIARKISEKGIKAKPYLKETQSEVIPNYRKQITDALDADIKEQLKKIKNDNKSNFSASKQW